MIIECTKKLADAMKIKVSPYDTTNSNPLYEWHANLFRFARRQGVLLMNNKTSYCIVLYGVKMEHFKKFDKVFVDAIEETFLAEGFSESAVSKYIDNCGSVHFTKTHDRVILGQMTDFDISMLWKIEAYLPSENINLVEFNKWIGSNLLSSPLGYVNPIKLLREAMETVVTKKYK